MITKIQHFRSTYYLWLNGVEGLIDSLSLMKQVLVNKGFEEDLPTTFKQDKNINDNFMIYSETEIKKAIHKVATQIEENYKYENEIVFVCILKGAFIFCADLIRLIDLSIRVEFITAKSYVNNKSTGKVQITNSTIHSINNTVKYKEVIIIEDIIDSGITINAVLSFINDMYSPKRIKVCTLIDKIGIADYSALEPTGCFIKGYGLDANQLERNLPYISSV